MAPTNAGSESITLQSQTHDRGAPPQPLTIFIPQIRPPWPRRHAADAQCGGCSRRCRGRSGVARPRMSKTKRGPRRWAADGRTSPGRPLRIRVAFASSHPRGVPGVRFRSDHGNLRHARLRPEDRAVAILRPWVSLFRRCGLWRRMSSARRSGVADAIRWS